MRLPKLRNVLSLLLVASAAALAACGDNAGTGGDDDTVSPDAGDTPPADRAVIVAGDFNATGVFTTVDSDLTVTTNAVAGVAGSDPVIRRFGDELFVINRFGGDNITIVDATTLTLVDQIATGAGSNPQDVAVVGRTLFVPILGGAGVRVIDRDDPDAATTIDLSGLDSADDLPDCTAATAIGDKVYVACGLLDGFNAVTPGVVAILDATTQEVTGTVTLPAANPTSWFLVDGTDLLISLVPDYQDYSTGCLARVTTGATPTATCVVTNQALGGFVNHLEMAPGGLDAPATFAWATINAYDESFNASGHLATLDLATGTASPALTPDTMVPRDFVVCGSTLFVADKASTADGVRVFAVDGPSATEKTSEALDIGLPPGIGGGFACL